MTNDVRPDYSSMSYGELKRFLDFSKREINYFCLETINYQDNFDEDGLNERIRLENQLTDMTTKNARIKILLLEYYQRDEEKKLDEAFEAAFLGLKTIYDANVAPEIKKLYFVKTELFRNYIKLFRKEMTAKKKEIHKTRKMSYKSKQIYLENLLKRNGNCVNLKPYNESQLRIIQLLIKDAEIKKSIYEEWHSIAACMEKMDGFQIITSTTRAMLWQHVFSGPVETLRQTASLTNLEIMKICEYCELIAPGYRFIHMYKPAVSQVFYDCVINNNINFHANSSTGCGILPSPAHSLTHYRPLVPNIVDPGPSTSTATDSGRNLHQCLDSNTNILENFFDLTY
ncbi:hypothetical protein CRE_21562 [Caenorhabditis remanei]|uniref:Uncharacterized protein n=1 Tax=Caenorhabditis remanei TaxID=31234 RepID=E3NFP6_CAERE|nr:hypothetical protein CRE_21562 [Caenorhabditis remanei]